MLPGVATPVGSGGWGAPQGKSAAHIDIGPNRLRGHGLSTAEPGIVMRSHTRYLAKRRAGVPQGLQESRCVVPLSALLLVAARSALLEARG